MNTGNITVTIDNCPDLLTVNEVAQILRISDKTAYSLVRSGKIKSFVVSNRIYRILKNDLLTFIVGKCA